MHGQLRILRAAGVRHHRLRASLVFPGVLLLAVLGCAVAPLPATGVGAVPAAADELAGAPLEAAFVVLGADGSATARAVIAASQPCPDLLVDGSATAMQVRVEGGDAAARARQADAPRFAVRVCEAAVPMQAHALRVLGRDLPLARRLVQRIVVIGDTGCRMKAADLAFQDCTDPEAWPFQAVARAAAREHPDLIIHVGDYHYRESGCPRPLGCAGSTWGYGWEAWNADFFAPARDLLAAAPWVVARGNHELCARAGQGWFRLLDPQHYRAERSCDDAARDLEADVSDPYAVPLGGDWQLVVFDSARASRALDPRVSADAAVLSSYQRELHLLARLTAVPGMHSIFVSHHPVLGYVPEFPFGVRLGTQALLTPMQAVNGGTLFPAGIDAALHGHVHDFQAIDFSSPHPATFVTGHGGDNLDPGLPERLPSGLRDSTDVAVDFATHASRFGYLVMERNGNGWSVRATAVDGASIADCELVGRHVSCARHGAVATLVRPAP